MKMEYPLDAAEKRSGAWLKIKDHIEKRIQKLREGNDDPVPIEATNIQRGRILELRELLSAIDPKEIKRRK